jgi:CheY-like chemotaxis protein
MSPEIQTVLLVDDEIPFLRTITDGCRAYARKFQLVTAASGREAQAILELRRISLVVTDLHMPDGDGFELLAAMSRSHPKTPVIVITAFGTPEIEQRLRGLGVEHHLDKPLEFRTLIERVLQTLEASASGRVSGITLPSFLQIIQIERKSCSVQVTSQGREGQLCFHRGELVDASTEGLQGDAAAQEIVCWDDASIELTPAQQQVRRTVRQSLPTVLMEGFRLKDERLRGLPSRPPLAGGPATRSSAPPATSASAPPPPPAPPMSPQPAPLELELDELHRRTASSAIKERRDMATTKEKLQELANLDGFAGAGVFTPAGEDLCTLAGSVQNIREVGVLANNVLMNAQKATLEMGAGRGQVVHVEGEKSHILVRCLNEGSDPLKSQPGRAHIHAVLIVKPDASIGMAKMRLNQVIEKLAEDFR